MNTEVNEDFLDMLAALNDQGVDFLVVGAYATAAHGFPRATGDIDVLVRPTRQNAERTLSALLEFGAPVQAHGISAHDFSREDAVYQIGLPPRRIDLLTSISAVSFDEACAQALVGRIGPHEVRFIGLDALIKNKRAAGRPKDVADASQLEQLKRGAQ